MLKGIEPLNVSIIVFKTIALTSLPQHLLVLEEKTKGENFNILLDTNVNY